jgi:hypothetical protein
MPDGDSLDAIRAGTHPTPSEPATISLETLEKQL